MEEEGKAADISEPQKRFVFSSEQKSLASEGNSATSVKWSAGLIPLHKGQKMLSSCCEEGHIPNCIDKATIQSDTLWGLSQETGHGVRIIESFHLPKWCYTLVQRFSQFLFHSNWSSINLKLLCWKLHLLEAQFKAYLNDQQRLF